MSKEKKCPKCSKGGTKDIINCGMCGIMNHFKCLPIESSVLSAISSDPSLFWLCNECLIEVRNGISNIGELQKCFNNQTLKQDLALA